MPKIAASISAAADAARDAAFGGVQDISKANSARHTAHREDTFQTPTRNDKKFAVPGPLEKRHGLSDSYTMLDICEKAFAKTAERISRELLQSVKQEIGQQHANIEKEMNNVKELIDGHEESVGRSMVDMQEQMRRVEERVERSVCDPVQEILRKETNVQLQTFQGQLTQSLTQLLNEVATVKQQQEQAASIQKSEVLEELHWNRTEMQRSGAQISAITDRQKTLLCEQSAHDMQKELTVSVGQNLDKQMQDFSKQLRPTILSPVLNGQEELRDNFLELLGEVGRIQRALNIDFVNVALEKAHRSSIKMNEETDACTAVNASGTDEQADFKSMGFVARPNKRLRVREFYTQTSQNTANAEAQTEPPSVERKTMKKSKKAARATVKVKPVLPQAKKKVAKNVFANSEEMKKRARQKLVKPQYNVFDFYHETGKVATIAKSSLFENVTFAVIFVNAIWISIDMDNNDAPVLFEAHPVFFIAENAFCLYFTVELVIRFLAFKRKLNCLKDFWFTFDCFLVTVMVLETWVLTAALFFLSSEGNSSPFGNLSVLRIFRIAKMIRITRMARLLREVPELVVLLKGIGAALRTVGVFSVLWLIIIYVFAIIFRSSSDGDSKGVANFATVLDSMETLLLMGVLPGHATLLNDVTDMNELFYPIILFFILLASMTLLNMLVGVMVTTIAAIAAAQQEGVIVSIVATGLREGMVSLGRDTNEPITKADFQMLVMQPDISKVLDEAGSDPVALLEMSDMIFEKIEKEGAVFTFEAFIEIVLDARGANAASVKDVKELLRIMSSKVEHSEHEIQKFVTDEFQAFRAELQARDEERDAMKSGEDDDDDDDDDEIDYEEYNRDFHGANSALTAPGSLGSMSWQRSKTTG
jgi:hypothetical protein